MFEFRIKDIYDRFELESSVDEFIGDNVQSPSQTNTIEQKHEISGFVIDEEETPFRKRKSNIEPKIKHHTPKKQCHKSDDGKFKFIQFVILYQILSSHFFFFNFSSIKTILP